MQITMPASVTQYTADNHLVDPDRSVASVAWPNGPATVRDLFTRVDSCLQQGFWHAEGYSNLGYCSERPGEPILIASAATHCDALDGIKFLREVRDLLLAITPGDYRPAFQVLGHGNVPCTFISGWRPGAVPVPMPGAVPVATPDVRGSTPAATPDVRSSTPVALSPAPVPPPPAPPRTEWPVTGVDITWVTSPAGFKAPCLVLPPDKDDPIVRKFLKGDVVSATTWLLRNAYGLDDIDIHDVWATDRDDHGAKHPLQQMCTLERTFAKWTIVGCGTKYNLPVRPSFHNQPMALWGYAIYRAGGGVDTATANRAARLALAAFCLDAHATRVRDETSARISSVADAVSETLRKTLMPWAGGINPGAGSTSDVSASPAPDASASGSAAPASRAKAPPPLRAAREVRINPAPPRVRRFRSRSSRSSASSSAGSTSVVSDDRRPSGHLGRDAEANRQASVERRRARRREERGERPVADARPE